MKKICRKQTNAGEASATGRAGATSEVGATGGVSATGRAGGAGEAGRTGGAGGAGNGGRLNKRRHWVHNYDMKTSELADYLYRLLKIGDFSDISLNGLQVGAGEREIKRVAFAVDACQQSIDKAASEGADMLFVHHGLFWGEPVAITGTHYNRVKTLLDNNIALFTCHIPLDASREFGNNAEMARIIGLTDLQQFSEFRGKEVGWYGNAETPLSIAEVCEKLNFCEEGGLKVLPFGPEKSTKIGIVSGGAADDVFEAQKLGLDMFVTGECAHEVYHFCRETGINMICGGHYASEVFGVKAVARHLESELGIETRFVDIPTSL